MTSIKILPSADQQVIKEETVGFANSAIVYAGLQSCISITGVHPGGLVGVHITIASDVDKILNTLRSVGGLSCLKFYVIGALQDEFKPNTSSNDFNKRKKIRNKIKELINPSARVYFCDTPVRSHVYVKKVNNGLKFYKTGQFDQTNKEKLFNFKAGTPGRDISRNIGLIYNEFPNLTEININSFTQR